MASAPPDMGKGKQEGHRFLVMERTDAVEGGMASVPPFTILRALKPFGELKISLLRNQTILLETQNTEQISGLQALTTIGKAPVKVSLHPKLNTSRGVIKCWDLCNCEREELLEELKEYNVVNIRQIKRHMTEAEEQNCVLKFKKKTRKNTGIFLVTFNTPELPKTLDVGYETVNVKLYIPKPLRCFRCQRLGHAMKTCKEQVDPKASQKNRKKPQMCLNCKGNHESWDKSCPVYKKQADILKLKVENQVPYKKAKILNDAQCDSVAAPLATQGTSQAQNPSEAPKGKAQKAKKSKKP